MISFNHHFMTKLFCLFCFTPFFLRAEEEDSAKIYSFLNQVIHKWSIETNFDSNFYYIVAKPDFSFFDNYLFSTDTLYLIGGRVSSPLRKIDSIQIFESIGSYKRFQFEQSKLVNIEVIPRKKVTKLFRQYGSEGWDHLSKQTKIQHGYLTISVPIFFDDGRKAVFYYGYHCGGLCGGGHLSIYKNINGIWTEQRVISSWVS